MKIGEAKKVYSAQLNKYAQQRNQLMKQKKELEEKQKKSVSSSNAFQDEAAKLELSYEAVTKKYDVYQDFMNQLTNLEVDYANMETTKQQADSMEKYIEDTGKLLEVARRLTQGAQVPPEDEKKLMDYSMDLYLAAKTAGMINKSKDREKYDSLWDDEEESPNNPDPMDVADDHELTIDVPDISSGDDISVDSTAVSSGASVS